MRFRFPAAAILFAIVKADLCKNFGAKCPKYSPCCNEHDWCGIGPLFCGAGCQPGKSYGGSSCLPQRKCRDIMNLELNSAAMRTSIVDLTAGHNGIIPNHSPLTLLTLDEGRLELSQGKQGAQMTMRRYKQQQEDGRWVGNGTRLSTGSYIYNGRASARMRMAAGSGVVTAFIFMADNRDEIDFEWVGKDVKSVQTNYYYRGVIDYTKGQTHELGVDLSQEFHIYTIERTGDFIEWSVDGRLLRTLWRNETEVGGNGEHLFPSAPSRVQFGLWDGGAGAEGTRQWAGETDWLSEKAIRDGYRADLSHISVACYGDREEISDASAVFHAPNRLSLIKSPMFSAIIMLFLLVIIASTFC